MKPVILIEKLYHFHISCDDVFNYPTHQCIYYMMRCDMICEAALRTNRAVIIIVVSDMTEQTNSSIRPTQTCDKIAVKLLMTLSNGKENSMSLMVFVFIKTDSFPFQIITQTE